MHEATYAGTMFRFLAKWLAPTIDAFTRPLPFTIRWRLLALQPLAFLTYSMKFLPYLFTNDYTVHWVPTREGHKVRTIVFRPECAKKGANAPLRPLHLDIHGGGFLGGIAEYDAKFCKLLARKTGAVVVSAEYRAAPGYPFPAAIDDIDDVVSYLLKNATDLFGADPNLFTVSGFSAGGNLAYALTQQPACQAPSTTSVKAAVTFYAAIDLRISPWQKPAPANFPTKDPLAFLLPLYDAYPGPAREAHMNDPRLSPIVAELKTLPKNMFFIIAGIDILVHEQLTFIERLKKEQAESANPDERRIESLYVDEAFHGWDGLPAFAVDQSTVTQAYDAAVDFIKSTHVEYGWNVNQAN